MIAMCTMPHACMRMRGGGQTRLLLRGIGRAVHGARAGLRA